MQNAGMSLDGWAVTPDGTSGATGTYLSGSQVALSEVIASAASAGQGDVSAATNKHVGYALVDADTGDPVASGTWEATSMTREVTLYALWTARLSGTVPMKMALLFDETLNAGRGGFHEGTAEVVSTTLRPLKVSSLNVNWIRGKDQGLQAIWPDAAWSYLATTQLTVTDITDVDDKTEAAIDARDEQHIELTRGGVTTTTAASDPENIKAGFKIAAATSDSPAIMRLSYNVRMNTSILGDMAPRPWAAATPGLGLELCDLVYTISLDD